MHWTLFFNGVTVVGLGKQPFLGSKKELFRELEAKKGGF